MERRYIVVNRRSWPEITIEILEVTLRPSNKMRIMYRSNLNFERFNRYFYDLLRKGFIEGVNGSDGRENYKITEQGRTLLDVLKKAEALLFSEED
jgi:predicted transcriptional regulator